MKLGFLGPKGTFSQQAALSMSEVLGIEPEYVMYDGISDCIIAANNGEIDMAVVPIENSIEGTVNSTVDTLIFNAKLYAKHSIYLPVNQNLIAKESTKLSEITEVYSHPQALAQSSDYLKSKLKKVKTYACSSTAEAAKFVSESDKKAASIGSLASANMYGLSVLEKCIQNTKGSYTEFISISKEKTEFSTKGLRTTIAFSTKNEPGQLYKFLGVLNAWDLNMTKIFSRPHKYKPGEYVFLIDVEGYKSDEDLKNAMELFERKTEFFKSLGTYNITDLRT